MSKEQFIRPLRVFLSYSSKNKILAGEIKQSLELFDFEVFLAHEDIEPAIEWQEEIIKQLKVCDIFLPIINENFKESMWTDQESGYALALDKFIIPLNAGLVPYGFIGKYQALKIGTDVVDSCRKILTRVRSHAPFKEIFDNRSIKKFTDSGSYSDANTQAENLDIFEPFTPNQINEIISGSLANDQIQGAYRAWPKVKTWFEKYKDSLQPILVEQFEIFTIRDKVKREEAVQEFIYRYLKKNGTTTDSEFIESLDLNFFLISRALSILEKEGKVIVERKEIDGQRLVEYSLSLNI